VIVSVLGLREGSRNLADIESVIDLLATERDLLLVYGSEPAPIEERFAALLREAAGGSFEGEDCNFFYEDVEEDGVVRAYTYQEFLRSEYWQIVAAYVKWLRGGRCQMCDSDRNLHTHHKTYKHKGLEYKHLDDLVVVCAKCHGNHHGKVNP
jgi:hypothetical protein